MKKKIKATEMNILCLNILIISFNPACTKGKPHSYQQGRGKYISTHSISQSEKGENTHNHRTSF